MKKKETKWDNHVKNERLNDKQNFASREISKKNRNKTGAGKGDHTSAGWITTDKYRRSCEANEAYTRGEITLDEWRFIVHGIEPTGQGED